MQENTCWVAHSAPHEDEFCSRKTLPRLRRRFVVGHIFDMNYLHLNVFCCPCGKVSCPLMHGLLLLGHLQIQEMCAVSKNCCYLRCLIHTVHLEKILIFCKILGLKIVYLMEILTDIFI
jgi:hypothetical protein